MKITSDRTMAMNIAAGNCLRGLRNCLMCAAFMSMPAKENRTPAARAKDVIPCIGGMRPSGVKSMFGLFPCASQTMARMVMTARGRNVPSSTPYLATLAKTFTPFVAIQQIPQ